MRDRFSSVLPKRPARDQQQQRDRGLQRHQAVPEPSGRAAGRRLAALVAQRRVSSRPRGLPRGIEPKTRLVTPASTHGEEQHAPVDRRGEDVGADRAAAASRRGSRAASSTRRPRPSAPPASASDERLEQQLADELPRARRPARDARPSRASARAPAPAAGWRRSRRR